MVVLSYHCAREPKLNNMWVRSEHLQVPDLVRQLGVIPFDLSHHFMSGHPRTVFTCLYRFSLAGHRIFKINQGMSSKLSSKEVFILICC